MDNPRSEKIAVVDEVRQHFGTADAAILTEYRGLKVKELAGLRRSLRASGGEYKIYKNTLVRLGAREAGLADLEEYLVGPTGITFVQGDPATVAKVLKDFSRTNPLLVIKGGVLGDKVIDARATSALAELPSREVLLARLAGAIAAPMQQFAGLLQALPRNLAYGLAALRDQRVEQGEATVSSAEAPPGPVADASADSADSAAESGHVPDTLEPALAANAAATNDSSDASDPAGAPDATPDSNPSSE
jgi:large subunit ribosomal protein L10